MSQDITAQTLIQMALKKCGAIAAGVTVQQTDLTDALLELNMMLRQWQQRRYLVFRLADVSCLSTGAPAYSVGVGGDINLDQRPQQIEAAYGRLLGNSPGAAQGDYLGTDTESSFSAASLGYGAGVRPLDFPLSVIASHEDYAGITMKGLSTFPSAVFYDPDIPLGGLYVWPIPPAGIWEIHILVKQSLSNAVALTSNLGLPYDYQEAVLYNLVMRLRPSYGLDPDPVVNSLAAAGLATLRATNSAIKRLNPNVPGGAGSLYWPGLEQGVGVGLVGGFQIGSGFIGGG